MGTPIQVLTREHRSKFEGSREPMIARSLTARHSIRAATTYGGRFRLVHGWLSRGFR